MLKLLTYRTGAVLLIVATVFAAIAAAQSRPASPAAPATDELLNEIRALRADLNHRFEASIRAQLLVARLQLQEQRISTLARQLTDIQQQLLQNERARGPLDAQLKMFEASQADSTESDKKGMDFVLGPLRSQAQQMARAEDELKQQQLYVSGLLAEEQSRWTTFNARLEELERALTARAPVPDR